MLALSDFKAKELKIETSIFKVIASKHLELTSLEKLSVSEANNQFFFA